MPVMGLLYLLPMLVRDTWNYISTPSIRLKGVELNSAEGHFILYEVQKFPLCM